MTLIVGCRNYPSVHASDPHVGWARTKASELEPMGGYGVGPEIVMVVAAPKQASNRNWHLS